MRKVTQVSPQKPIELLFQLAFLLYRLITTYKLEEATPKVLTTFLYSFHTIPFYPTNNLI